MYFNIEIQVNFSNFTGIYIRWTKFFVLSLQNPVAEDAGQYKCNIKNDVGDTNANLTLNFEQEPEEQHEETEKNGDKDLAGRGSRPGTITLS